MTDHEACLRLLAVGAPGEEIPESLTGAQRLAHVARISLADAEQISARVTSTFGFALAMETPASTLGKVRLLHVRETNTYSVLDKLRTAVRLAATAPRE